MKEALKLFVVMLFVAGLSACGGGGGGSYVPPPATKVGGTVTDTTLAPVAGATVEVIGTTRSKTTDSAGRYSFAGMMPGKEYTLKITGPDASCFPTFARATLTAYHPTMLDVYLTRAGDNPVPTVDAAAGGSVTSTAFIGGAQTATINLAANELANGDGTPYAGNAGVYIAPVDVGKLGYGLATYQVNLDNVFAAITASSTIYELYGSAAFRVVDGASNDLGLVSPSTSTLEIPIPASPADLRANAPSTATMIYLDETTGSWVEDGNATLDASLTSYTGIVSRPGIWRAVLTHDFTTLTEITGQATFNDGSAASGVTVYVNGVDYAYQNQTTTDANGNFASLVKNTGTVNVRFVVAANGAQWTHDVELVDPTAADVGALQLPFAPPVRGGVATQTVLVDNRDTAVSPSNAPDVMGYILGSGRTVYDPAELTDVTAVNVADFSFVANQFDIGSGLISLTPTESGSGIQVVAGQTFETLTTAPASGYILPPTPFAVNLEPGTATFPILIAVQTAQGNFAKVSIDSVTSMNAQNNLWQITFRHAFSLTAKF